MKFVYVYVNLTVGGHLARLLPGWSRATEGEYGRLGDDRYSAFDVRMDDRYRPSRRRRVGVRAEQWQWVGVDLRVDLRRMQHAEML